jgi:hypothetical protein
MKNEINKNRFKFSVVPFICAILLFSSCAGVKNPPPTQDPIMGDWTNDKGITVTIHRLPGNELVAEIISSRGFFSNDIGAGKIIIRNIQPFLARYSGIFIMPENEKSIKVQIRFSGKNTLVFSTEDKRAKGNLMVWKRVIKNNKIAPK